MVNMHNAGDFYWYIDNNFIVTICWKILTINFENIKYR